MRRRVHNFIRAFVACAMLTAICAAHAAAPVPAARPIYFEHLTMRDGLSQSTVMSVLQDSHGYLWLATESGLDRYDGYSVRAYRRERGNERGLASDFIWTIAEDANSDLWLATVGGGVARWDRRTDTFQQFRHDPAKPDSLSSDAVRTLLIDARGRIWVGTEQGLDLLDPKTGVARHFRHDAGDSSSLAGDAVFALYAAATPSPPGVLMIIEGKTIAFSRNRTPRIASSVHTNAAPFDGPPLRSLVWAAGTLSTRSRSVFSHSIA
jgi:ligand-binding sensor domain-containing protein